MAEPGVVVLDAGAGPELPLVEGGGSARAVVWPGNGAELRSLTVIELDAGSATRGLTHQGEAVYYVESGAGTIEADDESGNLGEGSMVHIDGGTHYSFRAGPAAMKLIGGPSPADHELYEGIEVTA